MAKKEIVVIGGGSGAGMIHNLLPNIDPTRHNVTLISPHPFSIYYLATARLTVTPEGALEESALIPFDGLIKRGMRFIQGRVDRVLDPIVMLESGESVKYDYLVVATGSTWEGPIGFPDGDAPAKEHIRSWRNKFASASSVIVVGGGAVGIGASIFVSPPRSMMHLFLLELACEVKHFYPKTNVTIVHASNLLMNDTYSTSFRESLNSRVKQHGVRLILGDRLNIPPEGQTRATTSNGVVMEADVFVRMNPYNSKCVLG